MCIRRPPSASHTVTSLSLTTSPGDSENSRTMSNSGQCHILVVYGTQGHLPNLPGYCYGTVQPCRPGGLHVLGLDWAVSTPASLFEGLGCPNTARCRQGHLSAPNHQERDGRTMRCPWDIRVTCSITQGSVAKVLLPMPWIPCSYERGIYILGISCAQR